MHLSKDLIDIFEGIDDIKLNHDYYQQYSHSNDTYTDEYYDTISGLKFIDGLYSPNFN